MGLPRLTLGREKSLLIFLRLTSIVIEIVKHEIQVRIDILGQMVDHLFFFIYGYAEGMVISVTTVNILLALRELTLHDGIAIMVVKGSRLREVCRTLGLLYQPLIKVFPIVLIMMASRGNYLSAVNSRVYIIQSRA